ncbi:MAG TPA: hypothetical protein VFU33_13205 [Gaiellaceae bacterium]|nr:hypothetical protein [Gaiellaceae bacterium]
MTNWLKRLFGGGSESSSSEAPEPVTAPEPASMPAEPTIEPAAEPEPSDAGTSDAGNEPA